MLGDKKTFSSFSVDDLEPAEKFYSEVLGIDVVRTKEGLRLDLADGRAFIYAKRDHAPATFTVLNFIVNDIEKAVDELSGKGVRFEQYGGDIKTDDKGIFRGEGPLIAWFQDTAGNILSLIEEG